MSGSQAAAGAASTKAHATSTKVEGHVLTDGQVTALSLEAEAKGHKVGFAAGVTAERARMGAILGSEHAEGRADLARHFAFESDTPAEAACAALAKAPKAEPPKAAAEPNRFDAAMEAAGNPKVGLDAPAGADEDDTLVASVLASQRMMTGTRRSN